MEDALSLTDAVDASLRFRVVRTPDGVAVEGGTANDHLFTLDQATSMVRVALERGDVVDIDTP